MWEIFLVYFLARKWSKLFISDVLMSRQHVVDINSPFLTIFVNEKLLLLAEIVFTFWRTFYKNSIAGFQKIIQ
jgi:hypothetical protein